MQLFVDREVARTNRNLLITSLLLLAALTVAGALSAGYYRDLLGGPIAATLGDIARANGKPARRFVTVDGELVETGYQFVEKTVDKYSHAEKSRRTTAEYLAVTDGEHTLLVKAPVGTQGARISGWLGDPEGVDREVLDGVRKDEPDMAGTWAPVVLDATASRTGGVLGLVAAGLLLLLVVRNLHAWSSRRARADAHPIWRRLARLGDARSLASQLDQETRGGDPQTFKGGATVTRSWLLHRRTYGLGLVPLDRLVWIHKKVTKHKNTFITVGKSYEAVVCDRDGGQLSIRASEKAVDGLLGALAARAPWALAGWSADLEKAWKSRRAEVVAAVDARRQPGRTSSGATP